MRINNQTYGLTYALNTKSNQSKGIKTYNNKFVSVPSESIIASKGLNFRSKNINQLYDEYNWYINHDHTPVIDAFLKIDDDKDSMDGFLGAILACYKVSQKTKNDTSNRDFAVKKVFNQHIQKN